MYLSDEQTFAASFTASGEMDRREPFIAAEDSACRNLTSPQNATVEHYSNETDDHQVNNKETFTFSSSPRSAPRGKSPPMSPESCVFPLGLKQDSSRAHRKPQIQEDFPGTDSREEVGHFVHVILDKVVFI